MVVMKTRVEVSRGVIWRWSVVWGEKGSGMERDVGCMVGVVVVTGGWEFIFCVARGSEDMGIMRGMLIDGLEPLNVYVPCSSVVIGGKQSDLLRNYI